MLVNTGAHGQREGLGSHWEIWAFVQGGMSPMQALQAATIDPARHLGLARDLGSIENGKLADLLIVDGNPLEDIRVTDDIAYVVLNGRIYEGGTLAEKRDGSAQARAVLLAVGRASARLLRLSRAHRDAREDAAFGARHEPAGQVDCPAGDVVVADHLAQPARRSLARRRPASAAARALPSSAGSSG